MDQTELLPLGNFGFVDECYHPQCCVAAGRIGYIQINILGHTDWKKSNPVKFDWLEKNKSHQCQIVRNLHSQLIAVIWVLPVMSEGEIDVGSC